MKDASIGVVVPAHDAARYLAEALDSILAQTAGRFRIVVVDDGSRDETAAIARRYAARNVLCLSSPVRRGIAVARNAGVSALDTDYLAFLDADDLWMPERTALLCAALNAAGKRPAMALGHVEHFVCPSLPPAEAEALRPPRAVEPGYLPGGILIRREDFLAVGLFDEMLETGEFIDWVARARRGGVAEIVIPDIVLRRRLHGANFTRRHRATPRDYLAVARRELARKFSKPTKV